MGKTSDERRGDWELGTSSKVNEFDDVVERSSAGVPGGELSYEDIERLSTKSLMRLGWFSSTITLVGTLPINGYVLISSLSLQDP